MCGEADRIRRWTCRYGPVRLSLICVLVFRKSRYLYYIIGVGFKLIGIYNLLLV